MKKAVSKRIPWVLFSTTFLSFLLCPTRFQEDEAVSLENQKSISDKNSFDVHTGQRYFEHLFGSSLADSNIRIEKSKFIPTIVDGSVKYCYYFDFEDDRGYAIFDDEKIYRFVTEGDFPWIFSTDVYYGSEGGFLYYNTESDSFQKVDDETGEVLNDEYDVVFSTSGYSEIDGCITSANLTSYVASVHPNWSLAKTVLMTNYYKWSMDTNSFYEQSYTYSDGSGGGNWYTEGNCAPNSMMSYLYNLPTVIAPGGGKYHYCENLISGRHVTPRYAIFSSYSDAFSYLLSNNTYILDENENYQTSGSTNLKKVSVRWRLKETTERVWSHSNDLYWQVRTESIKRGFDPRFGFYMYNYSEEVLETILNTYYGYNADLYRTNLSDNVVFNITFGIPVVIATNGSLTYGNHGMSIYGYKRYEYQEIVNGSSVTKSAYMWLVDDGWDSDGSTDQRWFDPNRGSTNNYFCTNRYSLKWSSC